MQAIIFRKNKNNLSQAYSFLKKHNLKPIKEVHETKNFYRFRLEQPNYKKFKYRTKKLNGGIDLILKYIKK